MGNLAECGVREWDVEYVDVDQEILFELILAANYLDIKPLLDLTCAKVASMIKGKTPGDPQAVQHRERFHAGGGSAGSRGEQVVRRCVNSIGNSPLSQIWILLLLQSSTECLPFRCRLWVIARRYSGGVTALLGKMQDCSLES